MQEEQIFQQFKLWRKWAIDGLKQIPEHMVSIIPEGFSNNIHWNAGHILAGWDHGIFPHLDQERKLSVAFHTFFPRESSPNSWEGQPPSFQEIIAKFEEQTDMLIQACEGKLSTPLKEPFLHMTTVGELFLFLMNHESLHMGVVKGIHYALKNK